MNPLQSARPIFQTGLGISVLIFYFNVSSFSAPVPLPDWVKPIQSSLPKLPPEVISEVDEMRVFIERNFESHDPQVNAQFKIYGKRIAELGELGDQAMIWQYLKSTNGPYRRFNALSNIGYDRTIAAWLLPIMRFRMDWLKQAIHDPSEEKYIKNEFVTKEIHDLEDYFLRQGEFADMENLAFIANECAKLNFESDFVTAVKKLGLQKWLQGQVKHMQEIRELSQQKAAPYWQSQARSLMGAGVLTEDALKNRPRNPNDGSNPPPPLGARKPLPEIKTPTSFPQSWMVWPMWLLIFAVSAALLRWVFRKPKRPSAEECTSH